jgi:hypothetical protein
MPASSGRSASPRSKRASSTSRPATPRPMPLARSSMPSSGNAGLDALYDDRDQPAGSKFATADLIGIPVPADRRPARPQGRPGRDQAPQDRRARDAAARRRRRAPQGARSSRNGGTTLTEAAAASRGAAPGRFPASSSWWRALPTLAPQRHLHLGHRLAHRCRRRHRRGDADRRHVGDERLPRRTARARSSASMATSRPIRSSASSPTTRRPWSEIETVDGVIAAIAYVDGQALASGLSR